MFHNKKKTEFSFGGSDSCGNIYYAAFYDDCELEIQPITKGHCLFLVYDLAYTGVGEHPVPPDYHEQTSTIVSAMKAWDKDASSAYCPEVMCYMLKYPYNGTDRSLSFQTLKNTDSTLENVLLQAKACVDFNVCVGKVHYTASYSVSNLDDYPNGICCEESQFKYPKTHNGDRFPHRVMLSSDSFVPVNFFNTADPDKEEFDEGTDEEEEDMIVKYYHWAAFLLWPMKRNAAVIGLRTMIDLFQIEAKQNRRNACLNAAANDIFEEMHHYTSVFYGLRFLKALLVLDNKELIIQCLNSLPKTSHCYHHCMEYTDFPMTVSIIGNKYGWNILKSPLVAIFKQCISHDVDKYCQFLKKISSGQLSAEQKDVCQSLAAVLVDFLINEKDSSPTDSDYEEEDYTGPIKRSKEFVQAPYQP